MQLIIGGGRIRFIDLAKGVCIFLVVMYHVGIDIPYLDIIRMPLYFILSGLFFKEYTGFGDFLIRKTNKILIPFVAFYLLGCLCYYALEIAFPGTYQAEEGFLNIFTTSHHVFNTPVWFLLCLFWVSNLFYLCILISHKFRYSSLALAISVVVIAIVGQTLHYFDIRTPLFIDCALSSLPFYYFGYLLKKSNILLPSKYDRYNWLFFLLLIGIAIFASIKLSLHVNIQYNCIPVTCYLISTIGVLAVLFLCKIVNYIPLVSYFGRYSIIILVTHDLVYRGLRLIVRNYSFSLEYFEWIQFLFVILVSLLIIPICIKYFPKITAQKDLIRNKYIQ